MTYEIFLEHIGQFKDKINKNILINVGHNKKKHQLTILFFKGLRDEKKNTSLLNVVKRYRHLH